MKKVLRILVIALGVILLLLIVTPMLFKTKIESAVKEKVNDQVRATVDWSKFSLSLFRGFPDLSINLHQVSVVGVEAFAGDTLAGLQRFELRVNLFSAIRKNIVVKSILLEHPLINGIVLEDGTVNWDITDETSAGEVEEVAEDSSDGSGSSMALSLKRFAISGGRIYYLDSSTGLEASLEGFNLELRGDFSMEQTELKLTTGIDRINAKMGGIRYLRDGLFKLELQAEANMVENRFTLKENLITLNGLSFGAEGEVTLLDEGAMEMDLKFFSRETSFQTLLSLVPALYLQDFESLKTSGTLQLDGTVSGTMKDSILPNATLNLQVKDGYFAYPDLPKDVSDVQISLHVDYKGADMDASLVDLERFHLLLGGNPFDLSLQVDHPVSDMHVAGRAEGVIDFASLQDVVPMEDMSLKGRLEADMRWDTKISYIEEEQYELVDLNGSLIIEGMVVEAPEIPVPVILEKMNMLFNPRMVQLATLDLKLGSSDLHMDGELENFLPYVFDGQTVLGQLNVTSSLLDVNELIPVEEGSVEVNEVVSDTLVPVPPDSLAQPIGIRIPENIDFAMTLDLQQVEYDNILVENIEGKMRVIEGVAGLEQLRMEVIEGSVITSGWVDTRGEFAEVDLALNMKEVDIRSSYETFVSVEKLAPMAKFCRGSANIDMEYHSLLDNSFGPLYESIDAKGQVYTNDLQFYNLEGFVRLGELLKNEKFNEMAPDEVNIGFTVRDGRIIIDPFHMDVDDSRITVSGSHGIDLTMDYKLDMHIAKTDLGDGANEMIQGLNLLAAGAGLKIPESDHVKVIANIRGTFNHPKVTTDLSGNLKSAGETIQAVVKEKITGEVEKVEEQVRDEASENAEKIIADAEEEAARLVEEARKAGDDLVKEAELQGEKLIEEAGTNLVRSNYQRIKKYRLLIRLIIESIIAVAVICISVALALILGDPDVVLTPSIVLFAILMYLIWITLYRSSSRSVFPRTERYRALIINSFQNTFTALLICLVFWVLIGLNTIPFLFISLFIGLRLIFTITERLAAYRIFKFYRSKGYNTKHLIVIADTFSGLFIEKLLVTKEWGFNVKYILTDSELIHNKFSGRLNVLREDADLKNLIDFDIVDEVIYCKNKINSCYLKNIIRICEEVGVIFRIQSSLSPLEPARLQLQTVHMKPDLQIFDFRGRWIESILKNISDTFLSFIALILLTPIFILIALIIRIDSRGPVFFIQERIGLRGRKFKLFKFRTMVEDAASVQHTLEKQNEADGPTFKIKYDPRVTKAGRILRKTGLDELPQLLNVVIGEMSLIGPRPPVEKEVIQYERWQLRRLSVKPGITCTWQVLDNRNEVSFDKWVKLDLHYIDNWTFLNDIKLMFRTVNTIIKATGS